MMPQMSETMNKEMQDTNLRIPSSYASTCASMYHIKTHEFKSSTVFRSSFQDELARELIISQVCSRSTNDFPGLNNSFLV